MAKTEGKILSQTVKIIDVNKKFTEPYTIKEDFVSVVCFHHAEVEKVVPGKKKNETKTVKVTERIPIMIIWDGSEFSYHLCEPEEEMSVKDNSYIIDREIDETPLLPSSEFVSKVLAPNGKKALDKFKPEELFNEVEEYFKRYFYLPHPMLYKVVALYVINMWVFDAHGSTPYLYIRSPDKGCGKSHLGQSIVQMTNGVMATQMKAHHIFRAVHGSKTVLGFDEMKNILAGNKMDKDTADIMELINVGFQADGGRAPRLIELGGGKYRTEWFDSYAPKIFITTSQSLPYDTQSRCIEVIMQRAKADEDNFGDRWFEPERKKRLAKIREMGALFRLKYGQEVMGISEDMQWRQKLDVTNTFLGLSNRELEIFRPLVILTLRFMPEWKDLLNKHVRKHIESRSKLEPTDTNAILFALRSLYKEVRNNWYSTGDDSLVVEFAEDDVFGEVMYVPVKAIQLKIETDSDVVYLGKNPASRIGRKLTELGFTTGAVRRNFGMVRVLKVSHLRDACERYLGMPLDKSEEADDDMPDLSQAEKVELVRSVLLTGDMKYETLLDRVKSKMSQESLDATIKHLKTNGYLVEFGDIISWMRV